MNSESDLYLWFGDLCVVLLWPSLLTGRGTSSNQWTCSFKGKTKSNDKWPWKPSKCVKTSHYAYHWSLCPSPCNKTKFILPILPLPGRRMSRRAHAHAHAWLSWKWVLPGPGLARDTVVGQRDQAYCCHGSRQTLTLPPGTVLCLVSIA